MKKESKTKESKTKARIKEAARQGIKLNSIATRAEVSYFKLNSVVSPEKYRGESSFDRFEEARINEVLNSIKNSI